ncbi:unnamed protein product [Rotaria sp. Silwood1]|nr:unnamed protein product [Rotaria sp. Silwood1]
MASQCFRYKDKELKVPTVSIDGDLFVMLEDVQHKFGRHILGFTLDGEPLSFMRDLKLFWLEPKRIRAHVDQIIDCDECENDVDDDIRTDIRRIIDTTQKTLDNTTLLIAKADAILRQAYELAEFTMPRLFIILPDDQSRFNPANLFNQSYRLFFLCECDKEHHLAFHEGYEINRPCEFLIRYGPYIRNMLKVVSTGSLMGTVFVQQLNNIAPQISVPNILMDNNFWHKFQAQIHVIDNALGDVMKDDAPNSIGAFGKQYLEGVDLREVKNFLKKVDDRQTWGNLYRSTNSDGAVRWLCIHHYESLYSDKKLNQHKREFRKLGGHVQFDVATIEANELKNIDEMVNILGKGLFVLELTLKECKIRESTFDNLLSILERNVYIQTFQLKNVTVSKSVGRPKSHSNIIAKLEKLLTHATQLTITYEVHIFDQTRIDMNAFENSLKNTKARLILHIYTQPALYLNRESDKMKCNCQPLLETFLKASEATTPIILSVNNPKASQFSLITNLQLRLK